MLMSGLFGEDLFDEFYGLPTQRELANIDKHLYGKNARNLMKTDVHETDTDYEMDVDLHEVSPSRQVWFCFILTYSPGEEARGK